MARLITSQHHLNEEIIAEKATNEDFDVVVSPEFTVDGEAYQVILDGHHSFAAALEAGQEPDITVASPREHDAVALLESGDIETFLTAVYMDGEYIDATTHNAIW